VKLIDFARKVVQQKKQTTNRTSVLVYRDINGLFTLKLPKDTPRGKSDPNDKLKKFRDDARNYRQCLAPWKSQIEFVTSSDITIQINPELPLVSNGGVQFNPQLCSFNEFYQIVSSGNVRKIEKLFYPLEYIRLFFSIQNQISSTTVLHIAAMRGHIKMVLFLVAKGSLINARDSEGNTALHITVIHGHLLMANQLICLGASVLFINNKRETPYDTAVNSKKDDFVSLLQVHHSGVLENTRTQQQQKELEARNSELALRLETTSKVVADKSIEIERLLAQVKELEAKLAIQQQSGAKYQVEVANLATRLVSLSADHGAELASLHSSAGSVQLGVLAANIGKFSHKPSAPPPPPSELTGVDSNSESVKLNVPTKT
jgi:hypothetical protein